MATALRPAPLHTCSSRAPPTLPASTPRISLSSSSSALLSGSFPPLRLRSRSAGARRAALRRSSAAGCSLSVSSALGRLADAELVYLSVEPEELEEKIPTGAGVYGVYDGNGELQFIGITKNIAASIVVHRRKIPDLCRSVKVGLIDEPEPDRATLTDAWKSWMQEYIESSGRVPPGNESGNSTWVSRPKQKPDLRLTPGPHVQLTVPLEELIDRLVKENKVVAFIKGSRSAPQCGFSQRVIGILNSHGVDYESVDVLDEEYNNGLRETLKRYSNWPTFPQIFVNGELLGGCDILTAMEEKGELAAAFEKQA